jgi:uracil DNA glycosylase
LSLSDLSAVAKQGVLWLNASLTVRAHKAASHARKGWETFTAEAVRAVLRRKSTQPGVVFMAWGLHAEKTCDKIGIDEVRSYLLLVHQQYKFLHRKSIFFSGWYELFAKYTTSNESLDLLTHLPCQPTEDF